MNNYEQAIYKAFDGKLVGSSRMREYVCKAVAKLSREEQTFVTHSCWFVGSMEDAWAFAFTGNDLKDQHLIFLSEELLRQDEKQIFYSIIHEIGHVMLGHRNSVFSKQTKQEIKFQETQADAFAKRYVPYI